MQLSKIFSGNILFVIIAAMVAGGLYYYYRVPPKVKLKELELYELNGIKFNNSKLENKIVLLSFYQSWCGPCIGEMSDFEILSKKFGNDFILLCVSDEDIARQTMVAQRFSNGNILFLKSSETLAALGVHTYPTNYIISRGGDVLYEKTAPDEWSSDKMSKQLEDWLKD